MTSMIAPPMPEPTRLDALGDRARTMWRWTGGTTFDTPQGQQSLAPRVTVLACGGASWARLGSDGVWASQFSAQDIAPFQPANMGFRMEWSTHMARHFGAPVKNVGLSAGTAQVKGEFVISQRGLEGSGIYAVSKAMREGAPLMLDLLPDLSESEIRTRLSRRRPKESLSNALRKTLKLSPVTRPAII